MRIKKDDMVIVITGKDKGTTGKVLKAIPKENKVVVEGVNVQTKHQKQTASEPAATGEDRLQGCGWQEGQSQQEERQRN